MTLPDVAALTQLDTADGVQQQVVGAIVHAEGRILLLQRPVDDFRGGTWELPSGKVDPGEDLISALHREVAEETGLTIAHIDDYLGAFDYTSGSGKHTRQHTWSVVVTDTTDVRLTEHDAYAWTGATDEAPVSPEVRRLIDKHCLATRR
jgi:8-oxo-dGTP diphosphatase